MDAYGLLHNFSQGNPAGDGQGDLPSLLRRLAEALDEIGVITIHDITFNNEVTEDGLWPMFTVYFHHGELGESCRCGCEEQK